MEKIQVQPPSPDSIVMCNTMNGSDKEACLKRVNINKAILLQNETLCSNVNETERAGCETTVIMSRAITSANPAMCEALNTNYEYMFEVCKDNALLAKAKMRKDSMICKEILTPSIKKACEDYSY